MGTPAINAASNAIHAVASFYTAALAEEEKGRLAAQEIAQHLRQENERLKTEVIKSLKDPVREALVNAAMNFVTEAAWGAVQSTSTPQVVRLMGKLVEAAQAFADQQKKPARVAPDPALDEK